MDIGVLTVPLRNQPIERSIAYLADLGVGAVELGCGGHPGDDHLPPAEYLDDGGQQSELLDLLDEHDMYISALATHNNPLHPDDDRAAQADEDLRTAITLASQLDVEAITCFSGLPAGSPTDSTPNWITAPWPPEHIEALEYQWEVAVDYWRDLSAVADDRGVNVAIEMHPNMLVHEPTDLVRLREETSARIGANFDPSHLYWQGIDISEAVRYLGAEDAIHHVHAKDTAVYEANARRKGVLDTSSYANSVDRSWLFRTVGYGHGELHWKRFVSTLRMVGYDGALSIEHEDALMSAREGLEKAVELLDRAIVETDPSEVFWTE